MKHLFWQVLFRQVVFQNTPYSPQAIYPANFLAFFIATPLVVRNGKCADSKLFLCDVGGNFRFKTKPVLLDLGLFEGHIDQFWL